MGNTYARLALGLSLRDATGGYRAFRAATLKGLDLDSVSPGLLLPGRPRPPGRGAGVRGHGGPITFVEREAGVSKMSRGTSARRSGG